ncbi:cytochrome c biogenesis CcdA family protein [Solirhodobacter olei]|uniref:cytochrome c biogenesis CcdA family protein n=1 Tax=Solirhodobacter olei TaxID=2493082 RepID=UPI000FDBECF7|nr:cytochrome c biogenesis protein CcdA [Solirhodobacter olei]
MTMILAYAAGLLVLINPCVLPVLPLVLASALQASRFGPLALALGLGTAFTAAGVGIAALSAAFGIGSEALARGGALALAAFGLLMMIPAAGRGFAFATNGFAARADRGAQRIEARGAGGQFLGGLLLGAIWSPCVGPTLGGALALAARGKGLAEAGATMLAFAAGTGTVILILGYGARSLISRNRAAMQRLAQLSRPLTGAIFALTGLALYFGLEHVAEGWLVSITPAWLQDLSVSI